MTGCKGIDHLPKCARVAEKVTTVIPPRSESLIPAKRINSCGGALLANTEGQERFTKRSQLLVAKVLVDLSGDVVPLRLLNPTNQPHTVYQDTIAAWCKPVERVSEAGRREEQTSEAPAGRACRITPCTASLPNHLVDLYQRTSSCLGETQKVEVEAFLVEFADVFAHSADALGRASIVSHEISTSGTRPICQHPTRLPLSQQVEAEVEIANMLQHGVIEPSSSSGASLILLVRKKDGTTRFCVDYGRLNAATVKVRQ